MGSIVAEIAEKLSASSTGTTQTGALTVGVDDTGHDVKFFGATSGNYFSWDESADEVVMVGTIKMKEQADAHADTAAFGQIWVNTATPNELWFTNDTGKDQKVVVSRGLYNNLTHAALAGLG